MSGVNQADAFLLSATVHSCFSQSGLM